MGLQSAHRIDFGKALVASMGGIENPFLGMPTEQLAKTTCARKIGCNNAAVERRCGTKPSPTDLRYDGLATVVRPQHGIRKDSRDDAGARQFVFGHPP